MAIWTNLPTSGTYYRFIPETNGKMRFKFEAKSMNYYRWDLPGNGTYYNTDLRNGMEITEIGLLSMTDLTSKP